MERVCFQMRVSPDKIEEYRNHHAAVWPDMLEALGEAGWQNYSLFLGEDGLVIGYVETEDFTAAETAMAATEINTRWQELMSEFFVPGKSFNAGVARLTEIFNLEDQRSAQRRAPEPHRGRARPGT